jgi:hypothetical protein
MQWKLRAIFIIVKWLHKKVQNYSYRVFFGIEKDIIFVLGIVSKKDAEKILKNLKNIEFPPEMMT